MNRINKLIVAGILPLGMQAAWVRAENTVAPKPETGIPFAESLHRADVAVATMKDGQHEEYRDSLNGRDLLKMGIVAAGLAIAGQSLAGVPGQPASNAQSRSMAGARPNIILILTDDQGYGDLGRNGNKIIQTPNLDKFHDEGVRFEDFHVSPTCSPTRSAIMSGRHEFKNGVTHTNHKRERMSLKSMTVAGILKSAGYATGVFGKWHLGDEDAYQPDRRGFDESYIHAGGQLRNYYNFEVKRNGKPDKAEGYCTDIFFGRAMKWIEAMKGKRPFFAYIALNAPHYPLSVPEKYAKKYEGKVGKDTASFFGMISCIDENVGKLMAKLKELGIDDNTLVVFMNDNGGTAGCGVFNAGMRGTKTTASNGGTRAISLWRWPGTIKPAACDKLTAHLDILPTFAELAGAKVPEDVARKLDGFSLVPLLKNPAAGWHDDRILFTHVGRWAVGAEPVKYGACSVRWKQYLQVRGKNQWSLFDLKADPGEGKDIASQHKDVIENLDKAYDAWWSEILPCLENEQAGTNPPADQNDPPRKAQKAKSSPK